MRKIVVTFALLFLVLSNPSCEEFLYRYAPGDRYRILSVVKEDVYRDRVLNHRAEILNRIAVEVTGVNDGKGRHRAIFQTSERSVPAGSGKSSLPAGSVFQWAREYESEFERDKLGYLAIDSKYFMPVVRNVPVFPGRDLKPGEKWSADGYEMHDFRDAFGIAEPYRIPFTANYTFLGDRQWKGKTYPAFSVYYRIITEPQPVQGRVWPKRIIGSSDQVVYWDAAHGQAIAYEEKFNLIFELSNGMTFEYRGTAEAEVIESEYMDKEKVISEINEDIERLKITDVVVKAVEEGVSISLDDIMFYPDSAVMLAGEREKLDRIAEILKRYPDRDIMVSGHTARVGSNDVNQKLSEARAKAVTDYLLSKNVRTADRIVVRGFGAERPIADNSTEEGRRKNRRVDITILEN